MARSLVTPRLVVVAFVAVLFSPLAAADPELETGCRGTGYISARVHFDDGSSTQCIGVHEPAIDPQNLVTECSGPGGELQHNPGWKYYSGDYLICLRPQNVAPSSCDEGEYGIVIGASRYCRSLTLPTVEQGNCEDEWFVEVGVRVNNGLACVGVIGGAVACLYVPPTRPLACV
jgi:hypothetical protein